jgi:hypothetical protein
LLRSFGPGARRSHPFRRPYSAAALYRRQARRGRARPRRLPDHLRPRGGRRRGAHGRPAFHAGAIRALDKKGVERHFVTLHVGAGTFLPIKADDTDDHKMHLESGYVSGETAAKLNAVQGERRADRLRRHHLAAADRKRGPGQTAKSAAGPAPPASSSRPATASRRSIC